MSHYPKNRVMNPLHSFISDRSQALGDRAFFLVKWGRLNDNKRDELCLIRMDLLLEAAAHRNNLDDFKVARALQFAELQLRQIVRADLQQIGLAKVRALQKLVGADVRRKLGGVS